MRALLQRVTEAQVAVDGVVIGQCGPGLMILVCAMQGDDEASADKLAQRVAKMMMAALATNARRRCGLRAMTSRFRPTESWGRSLGRRGMAR